MCSFLTQDTCFSILHSNLWIKNSTFSQYIYSLRSYKYQWKDKITGVILLHEERGFIEEDISDLVEIVFLNNGFCKYVFVNEN